MVYGYVRDSLESVLEAQRDLCRLLKLLPDKQKQLHLLRSCLSVCKFQHLLGATECSMLPSILSRADMIIRDTLQAIMDQHLTGPQWEQARSGVKEGGLGIQVPSNISGPARLSAILAWQRYAPASLGLL